MARGRLSSKTPGLGSFLALLIVGIAGFWRDQSVRAATLDRICSVIQDIDHRRICPCLQEEIRAIEDRKDPPTTYSDVERQMPYRYRVVVFAMPWCGTGTCTGISKNRVDRLRPRHDSLCLVASSRIAA